MSEQWGLEPTLVALLARGATVGSIKRLAFHLLFLVNGQTNAALARLAAAARAHEAGLRAPADGEVPPVDEQEPCAFLEKAALDILSHVRPTREPASLEIERARAAVAALSVAEAQMLGQAPAEADADDEDADAAGDGTADEDDALLELAMASLVDLTARKDSSKAVVATLGGCAVAVKYHRNRPLGGLAKSLADFVCRTTGKGGAERSSLGAWQRTLPLHLLLNVSGVESARLRCCGAAFGDLLGATRGRRLKRRLARREVRQATGADGSSSDSSNSENEKEDVADEWARALAFATLANLSRSMECRQRVFKLSLANGIMPPGVHPSVGEDKPSARELALQKAVRGCKAPPKSSYLAAEIVEAMALLKGGPASAASGKPRVKAGAKRGKEGKGRRVLSREQREAAAAEAADAEGGFEESPVGNPFLLGDGGSFNGSFLSFTTTATSVESAVDMVVSEDEHLACVVSWMFNSLTAPRPKDAPNRTLVRRPDTAFQLDDLPRAGSPSRPRTAVAATRQLEAVGSLEEGGEGLVAARRRVVSDGSEWANAEAYPAGSDQWHPRIAKAALSAEATSKVRAKGTARKRARGAAAAKDPRTARASAGVAVALEPVQCESSKFAWGRPQSRPATASVGRTLGLASEGLPASSLPTATVLPSLELGGTLGSAVLPPIASPSTARPLTAPTRSAVTAASVPVSRALSGEAAAETSSSGRVWMWPHVKGSRIGHDCGLVPFQVTANQPQEAGPAATGDQAQAQAGFHFYHRANVSAAPFPAPPLPAPLPPMDLGRIFQLGLPEGSPPLVPTPDGGGESGAMTVGGWALLLDFGQMAFWTKPPPWLLPVDQHCELVPIRVGEQVVEGGVPPQPAFILCEAPPPLEANKAVLAGAPTDPPGHGYSHTHDTSVWHDRPKLNDGKDYVDGGNLYEKALNRDWRRLLNEDRFFKFVDREDDHAADESGQVETVEDELEEVKEVLFKWAGPLLRMFDYYCLLGAVSNNNNENSAFSVGENSYYSMCSDLRLVDGKKCSKGFLGRTFIQVNVESDAGGGDGFGAPAKGAAELQAQNFVNEDRALMRFEFLEALVRIAVCRYKEAAGGDVSEALELLMHNHVDVYFVHRGDKFGGMDLGQAAESLGGDSVDLESLGGSPMKRQLAALAVPLAGRPSQTLFVDPNTWRCKSLYTHSVDDLLKSHQRALDIIFNSYSRYGVVVRNGISQKDKVALFSLQCWMDFLEDSGLLAKVAGSGNLWGKQLSQRDAKLAFFLSRFTVVDEVKNRNRCMSLDRLEFYECLCRTAEIMSEDLPLASDLERKNAADIVEYEVLLSRESKVSGPPTANMTVSKLPKRRSSFDSSSGSESDDDNDGDAAGEELAERAAASRKALFEVRKLHDRLEMLIRVFMGRLAMKHQGQLQHGKQFLKFVPRYIAKPETLTVKI